ncbi:MAG TPA: 16S rRNA (guanine(966)-N(2))-methyltransferase RsmD [Woeseiaceae bacterium]|nr:16S rRNA (guanine(966)-N(2))-methyltransferase RsmD [Woeseiaceae bacterium]
MRQPPEKTKSRPKSASGPGRLRIVAGFWRSRVLEVADVPGLRPTPERVRETLFNWLTPGITGKRCLDLYAGTGALGLEALSRGAKEVVFVEKSLPALASLKRNVAQLDAKGAEIYATDATLFLRSSTSRPFDFVFLDPPFAGENLEELCRLLDERELLQHGAKVYLEMDRARELPQLPGGWVTLKEKTAGNVRYALVAPELR